jgi:hypothetical protein
MLIASMIGAGQFNFVLLPSQVPEAGPTSRLYRQVGFIDKSALSTSQLYRQVSFTDESVLL